MYNIGDKLEYDRQCWQVEKRFIAFQDRQYANMTLIDGIALVMDYDTNQVYTLIGCHADDYGLLSCEQQLNKVIECLYCPMLLVCHPGIVQSNYGSIWPNLSFCGLWEDETIAFVNEGILYVCSDTNIQ